MFEITVNFDRFDLNRWKRLCDASRNPGCVALTHGVTGKVLMAKNPFEFIQEVRQEVSKVTWPSWSEVWITTVMVLIMVTLAAIFFFFADMFLSWIVGMILELGK